MLLTHTSGEAPDVSLKDPWGLAAPDRAEGFRRALSTPQAVTPQRHPELVSGSSSSSAWEAEIWMLKQVQHDGLRCAADFDFQAAAMALNVRPCCPPG
jgi:hypothetical protein